MNQPKAWITKTEFAHRIARHYKLVQPKLKQAIDRGELTTKNGKIE